jgi:hypothetical protein
LRFGARGVRADRHRGLSAGVDAVAGPLLWPLLVGLAVWALRKGARWPLLAPALFVAVWGDSALAAVACSAVPVTVGRHHQQPE